MLGKQIFFSMLRLIFFPLDPDPKHRLNNVLLVEFKMKFTKSAFWKKQEPNILFCFVFRIANTESTTDIAAFSRNLNDTNRNFFHVSLFTSISVLAQSSQAYFRST